MALSTVSEDRLSQLKELRGICAESIEAIRAEDGSKRDLAALIRQYRDIIREIDELENGEDGDDRASDIVKRHRQSE